MLQSVQLLQGVTMLDAGPQAMQSKATGPKEGKGQPTVGFGLEESGPIAERRIKKTAEGPQWRCGCGRGGQVGAVPTACTLCGARDVALALLCSTTPSRTACSAELEGAVDCASIVGAGDAEL